MNKKDAEIITMLRSNARMKNTEIARKIGLTEGAIRARIANLIEKGVIRKFTIETKPVGVESIVLVESEAGRSRDILEKLKEIAETIFETSGEFDAAVMIRTADVDQLNSTVDRIREIPGVVRTSTLIRLA